MRLLVHYICYFMYIYKIKMPLTFDSSQCSYIHFIQPMCSTKNTPNWTWIKPIAVGNFVHHTQKEIEKSERERKALN